MTRSALIFLSLAFTLYWLMTVDQPGGQLRESFAPALPKALRQIASGEGRARQKAKATESFQDWLRSEAKAIGSIVDEPDLTLRRLQARARRLRPLEVELLQKNALDRELNGDERFLAIYLLGLNERPMSLDALKDVASSPWPPTQEDRKYSEEAVIRVHALESVVKRLSRQESVRFLHELLRRTSDPQLAKHAQYWLGRLG